MRRMLLLAPLALACSVRSGCDAASVRHEVDGLPVEVTARGVKNYGIGGFGLPHVGGILWPKFDGYGVELRLSIEDRPPFAVAMAARAPEVPADEDELQAAARSVELTLSPDREHLGFRTKGSAGWTVVHMLPQGVPFRSRRGDVMTDESEEIDWAAFPSPESIALEAIGKYEPDALVLDAIEAQHAAQPWDDALLEAWQPGSTIHGILVARLESRDSIDPTFVSKAGEKALPYVSPGTKNLRSAVDLLLALGDSALVAQMDEKLLRALPDREARRILGRRVAPVRTIGRKHPPSRDLTRRARAAIDELD